MNLERLGAAAASTSYQARCKAVRMLLPQYIGNEAALPESIAVHLSSCLVCRAEADRLRRVADYLAEGRRTSWTPPASLIDAVMEKLDTPEEDHAWRKMAAAAVIVAGIGVVVGAVGLRRKSVILAD